MSAADSFEVLAVKPFCLALIRTVHHPLDHRQDGDDQPAHVERCQQGMLPGLELFSFVKSPGHRRGCTAASANVSARPRAMRFRRVTISARSTVVRRMLGALKIG